MRRPPAFAAAGILTLALVAWFPFAIAGDEAHAAYTGAPETATAGAASSALADADPVAQCT